MTPSSSVKTTHHLQSPIQVQ